MELMLFPDPATLATTSLHVKVPREKAEGMKPGPLMKLIN